CKKGDAGDAVELPANVADRIAKSGPGQARGVGHLRRRACTGTHLPSILRVDEIRSSQLGPLWILGQLIGEPEQVLEHLPGVPSVRPRLLVVGQLASSWRARATQSPRSGGYHEIVGLLGVRSHTSKKESRSWPDTSV
ncbi:MAG TPA: hypothetical protein VGW74_17140, partial [Propionibacteriaceae bacterium]|nr:hypothetical protein [Propionibacteriaceae bacterium]